MKNSLFQLWILLIIFFGIPEILAAQPAYVSDTLFLTFRDSPGESSAVIKRLKSDTPVFILEEQGEYYKVELESKEVGWVDKRFISFETPKTIVIETLKQEKKDLEDQLKSIKNQISAGENTSIQKIMELETSLKTAKDEAEKMNASLTDNTEKYNTLLEQSGNIQKLINENKALHEKNEALSSELAEFKSKNTGFLNTDMIKWSLSGVGVLMLGWIIGHSVSVSKRKRSSFLR